LTDDLAAAGLATTLLQCRGEARDNATDLLAFGARDEAERHAVLQHRLGERDDVVDRRRESALEQSPGADCEHQRLARARARTPGDEPVRVLARVRSRAGRAHQLEDGLDNL